MKKVMFLTMLAALLSPVAASAQEYYTYRVMRTQLIDWEPEAKGPQRYTVAINPFHLVNKGLKFDFEVELDTPGNWFGTSLTGYYAPPRREGSWWRSLDGNDRNTINSGGDDYNKMWGIGTSAMYKNIFHPRGWYFQTGLLLEFFRVTTLKYGFAPYNEDGLTFYEEGMYPETRSYFKPSAVFNLGKHMALSQRCFFDMFIGLGFSYSIYKRHDDVLDHNGYYQGDFSGMYGFAYRGFYPNWGFRFGVLIGETKSERRF